MIRYKTVRLTIPANSVNKDTILTIPAGKKIKLKAFGKTLEYDCLGFIEIEADRVVELPCDFAVNQGNFVPVEMEIEGPKTIEVGGEDTGGSDHDVYMTIAYEE